MQVGPAGRFRPPCLREILPSAPNPFVVRTQATINLADDLRVRVVKWIFRRSSCLGASFDLVNPIEEFGYGFVVAGRGFGGQLHGSRLKLSNFSLLSLNGHGNGIVNGFHYDCTQVLAAGLASWPLPTVPFSELRMKRRFPATYSIVSFAWVCFYFADRLCCCCCCGGRFGDPFCCL